MATRKKPTLLAQGKPRALGGSARPWRSSKYAEGLPADVKLAALTAYERLPFVFEASGTETHLTNGYDPDPRARRIFNFPKPSTLAAVLKRRDEEHPTWRCKGRDFPMLDTKPLCPAADRGDHRGRDEPARAATAT